MPLPRPKLFRKNRRNKCTPSVFTKVLQVLSLCFCFGNKVAPIVHQQHQTQKVEKNSVGPITNAESELNCSTTQQQNKLPQHERRSINGNDKSPKTNINVDNKSVSSEDTDIIVKINKYLNCETKSIQSIETNSLSPSDDQMLQEINHYLDRSASTQGELFNSEPRSLISSPSIQSIENSKEQQKEKTSETEEHITITNSELESNQQSDENKSFTSDSSYEESEEYKKKCAEDLRYVLEKAGEELKALENEIVAVSAIDQFDDNISSNDDFYEESEEYRNKCNEDLRFVLEQAVNEDITKGYTTERYENTQNNDTEYDEGESLSDLSKTTIKDGSKLQQKTCQSPEATSKTEINVKDLPPGLLRFMRYSVGYEGDILGDIIPQKLDSCTEGDLSQLENEIINEFGKQQITHSNNVTEKDVSETDYCEDMDELYDILKLD